MNTSGPPSTVAVGPPGLHRGGEGRHLERYAPSLAAYQPFLAVTDWYVVMSADTLKVFSSDTPPGLSPVRNTID